jgi:hypothetical protein
LSWGHKQTKNLKFLVYGSPKLDVSGHRERTMNKEKGLALIGWLGWIAFAVALVSAVIVYQGRQKTLADLAIALNRAAALEQEIADRESKFLAQEGQIEGLIKRNQQLDERKRTSQSDSAKAIEELTRRAAALEGENAEIKNRLQAAEAELAETKQQLAEARVAPVLQPAQP